MEELQKPSTATDAHQPPPGHATPGILIKLQRNKPLLILGAVITVALVGALVFVLTGGKDKPEGTAGQNNTATTGNTSTPPPAANQNSFAQQYSGLCKERDVKFTSPPLKDIGLIRPLGAVNDGHVTPTDHVYIGGPNPNAPDNTYPVLMPADGTVIDVGAMPAQYIGDKEQQKVAQEDHRIVISHSCRYFSIYIHVHKLSDKLKEAFGTLQPNENKRAALELKAGDVVGYIGGSTFDWTPIDTAITLKGFISPELYEGESWKIHTVSPFDLYTGTLKAELEAKSMRTAAPLGGKIDYDVAGKLIGNWFREGSGGYSGQQNNNGGRYWDGHLSVVPDYIDPASTIVSIGNWTGEAKQFGVKDNPDPSKISEKDGMVKYELIRLNYVGPNGQASNGNTLVKGLRPSQTEAAQGTIAFQVLPGEKLKVEKFPGKTPAQVTSFTAAAQIYDR